MTTHFDRLPYDVITILCNYISIKDISKGTKLCPRHFGRIEQDVEFWVKRGKYLFGRKFNPTLYYELLKTNGYTKTPKTEFMYYYHKIIHGYL